MRKIVLGLAMGLLLASPISAYAAATQTDVDYSKKVSATIPDFQKAVVDWGAIAATQPSITISPKYKTWKTSFTASSNQVIKSAKVLDGLKGTPGFKKSDQLLHSAMASYISGIQKMIAAVEKNDSKAMNQANAVLATANKSFLSWQTAYQADIGALNR